MSKPTTIVIAILLFAVVITTFGGMMLSGVDDYNQTVDSSYMSYLGSVNTSSSLVNKEIGRTYNASGRVQNSSAPDTNAGISITGSVWSTLTLIGESVGTAHTFINDTLTIIGIPGWIVAVILAILLIVVVSIILGRIFGRDI